MSREKRIKQIGVACPYCHAVSPLTVHMDIHCPNCKKVMAMGYITTLDNYIKEEDEITK